MHVVSGCLQILRVYTGVLVQLIKPQILVNSIDYHYFGTVRV